MRRTLLRAALVAISIGVVACNSRVETPQLGIYRAVLSLPGGDTPFGLEVAQEQQQYVLYLINGAERTRVSDVKVTDGELTATFPGYENTLRAKINRDSLEGSVTLIKASGKEQVIPFVAKRGEAYRFHAKSSTDNADVDGTWDTTFTNEKGETTKAILLLEQSHDLQIDFPTLIAGLSETDEASKALPMLSQVYGYPTSILVDRKGVVRSIHTGFAGPATGRHHDECVKEFSEQVERLLTESGG